MSNSTDPVAAGGGGSAALVFYGVALSAVASTISNLGVNVQKYGFILEAKKVRHPCVWHASAAHPAHADRFGSH